MESSYRRACEMRGSRKCEREMGKVVEGKQMTVIWKVAVGHLGWVGQRWSWGDH